MQIFTPTPAELKLLRDSISAVRRDPVSQDFCCEDYEQPANETVIAEIPYDGIPPASIVGADIIAGKAECILYALDRTNPLTEDSDVKISPMLLPSTQSFTEWVHNPYRWRSYGKPFNGKMYQWVTRERSGVWVCEKPRDLLKCKPVSNILPGSFGTVEIWLGGNASAQLEVAWLNWGDGGTTVNGDTEQFIKFFPDEGTFGKWVIIPRGTGGTTPEVGVNFINDDIMPIPPHAVMAVPDTVRLPEPFLLAYRPFEEFQTEWLINGPDAVAPGDPGMGWWRTERSGPVAIEQNAEPFVEVGWGPKPGSFLLHPFRDGFDILASSSATINGQMVAEFIQHPGIHVYGKLHADLDLANYPAGNISADFEIFFRDRDEIMKPAGWGFIKVYPFWANKGTKYLKGTKGDAYWYGNYWEGDFACDVDDTNSGQQAGGGQQGVAQQFFFNGQQSAGLGIGF